MRLKLYPDAPLVKLVILGEYLWLQHGPADLAVQHMPEYVLRRSPRTRACIPSTRTILQRVGRVPIFQNTIWRPMNWCTESNRSGDQA